uniref:Uncharacterized protein n=1 Tax=Oryza glaberrima TaxID=4538 RepID=I1Q0D5_ORYGL
MAAAAEGASCWWRMECAREWKAGRERDQMKAGASVEAMTSERSGKIGGGRSGDDATSSVSEKTRVRFGAAAQEGGREGCLGLPFGEPRERRRLRCRRRHRRSGEGGEGGLDLEEKEKAAMGGSRNESRLLPCSLSPVSPCFPAAAAAAGRRPPSCCWPPSRRRRSPLSRLACRPPAALPRLERETRRKRRVMTWITLTCGVHVGPTLTQLPC